MKTFIAGNPGKYGENAVKQEGRLRNNIKNNRMLSFYYITTKDVQPKILKEWLRRK
jgi:hypothetical protein